MSILRRAARAPLTDEDYLEVAPVTAQQQEGDGE